MSSEQALKLAHEGHLDLVEIAPTAKPPVCRIMDYGKFRYQRSKKTHDAKRRQHHTNVKEVKFRPAVDEHDYQFKKKHVERFLKQGDKVKLVVMFRGRERTHRELGHNILDRVLDDIAELGQAETRPRSEGPQLTMVVAPRSTGGGKSRKAKKPEERKGKGNAEAKES